MTHFGPNFPRVLCRVYLLPVLSERTLWECDSSMGLRLYKDRRRSRSPVRSVMPKRQRKPDWTNKVDAETGEETRFCTGCDAFLPLGVFYPSSIRSNRYACKQHEHKRAKPAIIKWRAKRRGDAGSVARVRANLNQWMYRVGREEKWTDDGVENALEHHGVILSEETRTVRIRPRDPHQPFTAENSVVKFQNRRLYI